jgi:hypothetical protein
VVAYTDRELAEQGIFAMFAKAANLPVLEGSIQSRKPPEPDILCEIAGAGSVSFELVEIAGEKFSQYTNTRPALRRRFAEAYAATPTDMRSHLEARLGGPPAVIVGFVPGTSPGQWSRAIKPILQTLEEHATTIEPGEFRVGKVERLRGLLTDMWVHSEGKSLYVAEATLVADPAVDRIRAKFKKQYRTAAPIELVAYYASQPAPTDSIWRVRVARLFGAHLAKSPFRRVWIFDSFTRTIVLDSQAEAQLDKLVRLKRAQPIARELADLPDGADIVTLAGRGAKFKVGRAQGALDPLGHLLLDILAEDPRMSSDDVRDHLEKRKGRSIIVDVRVGLLKPSPGRLKRTRGLLVEWRHPETGRIKTTAWSSIVAGRLPQLRTLAGSAKTR